MYSQVYSVTTSVFFLGYIEQLLSFLDEQLNMNMILRIHIKPWYCVNLFKCFGGSECIGVYGQRKTRD